MAKIDAKYLKGLKYRGANEKIVEEDGRKKRKYIPYERDLMPDDVMSFNDKGAEVVIATKDGKKYKVSKKSEAEAKP